MAKSIVEFRERRIKQALDGVSYPMVYVRQAWYVEDGNPTESYIGLQERMRKVYPELIRRITTPPYPHAAIELSGYWQSLDEATRLEISTVHALLYMRLEWFTEYMLRRSNKTVLDDVEYEEMHTEYEDAIRRLL